jgi:oligoendopeptidase F
MPTLARFELETHQRLERGESLGANEMVNLLADLFEEGFGGALQTERPRLGIIWATFGHLFSDYYVYQYATGISAANALSQRILNRVPGAVGQYLEFLKAGSSLYPLDALRLAGVDLTSPQPVEQAFTVLADYVNRLESLLNQSRQSPVKP